MIDYSKVKPGDKLKIVGMGAPGFAKLGDIVEVISTDGRQRCDVKREDGETAYFALTCGAQRLEAVETTFPPLDRKAAKDMTADEREAELARVEARIANGFGEHGGSPGEWWHERADELRYWMDKDQTPPTREYATTEDKP